MGVLQDTNGIPSLDAFVSGLLGLLVGFDTEGGVLVPRRVSLDADLFDRRVLGDFPVIRYRYLADFPQSEPIAPRIGFDDFEPALAVGERLVPARPLPSKRSDLVSVLFLR